MERVKVMQVGIGGYGRTYIGPMLEQSPTDKYELVGVVDRCQAEHLLRRRCKKEHPDL